MIVKKQGGWHVVSKEGKNLGGPYGSYKDAAARLREIEMFKHMKK